MNSNGRNRNNTFEGDVLIDGNLTVTGTYPGGGGGGDVTNPMSSNLDAGNYAISNLSEISAGIDGFINTASLNLQANDISDVKSLTMSNGLIFDDATPIGTTGQALILGDGGVVAYSDVLTNPLTIDLQANNLNILNVETLGATYIDTNSITPLTGSTINVFGNIDMNSNGLRRVDIITCRTTASPSVDLKLDLVPATVGSPNQVLARDPAFNPAGAGLNTKTVWLDAVLNPMTASLNANSNTITNLSGIGSPNGGLDTMILNGDIKSNNGNFITGITNITGYGGGIPVLNLNGDVKITTSLDLSNNIISRVEVLDVNYLVSYANSAIRFNSPIYLETNMNASGKNIFNVSGLTCDNATTLPSVYLNLDLVPLTQGTANQVLARDPAFNPANPATHKLVWQTPAGGGGGVNNPMTVDLDANTYNINNVETLGATYIDTNSITPKIGSTINVYGNLDLNSNAISRVDTITCRTTASPSVDLKLDLVPATIGSANQVLGRNPAFNPAGLNTKTVWLDAVLNPITANIEGAQYNMFDMNQLQCKGLNIMVGGYGISCENGALQVPINWGIATKLSTDPFYRTFNTDYITPATGAGVTIDSKLQDGKTDSRITLSSPSIVINNSTNPSPTAIEIKGNIQITNNSGHIQGDTLFLRGRTSGNVPTPLTIESSITNITSFTLNVTTTTNNFDSTTNNFYGIVKTNTIQPYTGSTLNISATDVNISNHLNVLTNRSPSIGVRTTLFKTFGQMPIVNINTLTPIKLNSIIVNQKGDNFIPPNAFINGDKFIIIMNGILTSIGSGSLNIFLYIGAVQALSFSVVNVASTAQPCKITIETDITVTGTNVVFLSTTALLSMERTNTSIRYAASSSSATVDNTSFANSIDIYVSQSATQVSSFTPISYTIEQL